jgi:hypothetical protein
MKNVFVITNTPIQSTMIVTLHAVKNLIRGAEAYNNDINAIDENEVQYNAGQVCARDDQAMRERLVLNEYKPCFGDMPTNVARYLLQVFNTDN